jgi:hypothetical protein
MMRAVGIRRVHYTGIDGTLVSEKIKDMISIEASSVTRHIEHINSPEPSTDRHFFEKLLKTLFPASVKIDNFYNFIKHNLSHVLPTHRYQICNKKGHKFVSIISPESNIIISAKLI